MMVVYKSFEICPYKNGYTVDYCGDMVYFDTVEDAMEFIDSL